MRGMHHESTHTQQEVQALRSMGAALRLRYFSEEARPFQIEQHSDCLYAAIDLYSVLCPEAHTPAFNVDTWERLKVRLQSPRTRYWFTFLRRVCRTLLARKPVLLPDAAGTRCLSMSGVAFIPRDGDERAYPEFLSWARLAATAGAGGHVVTVIAGAADTRVMSAQHYQARIARRVAQAANRIQQRAPEVLATASARQPELSETPAPDQAADCPGASQ